MKRILLAFTALVFLTGGAGEAPSNPSASPTVNPYENDAKAIEAGGELFKRVSCHGCHGSNGRGATGPDLTDETWIRQPTDQMIFNVIKFGRKGTMMSPFKDDLADDQIWYLVSYLRELGRQRKAEGG